MEAQWQQQLAEAEQKLLRLVLWSSNQAQDLSRKLPRGPWLLQEATESRASSARKVPTDSKPQRRQDVRTTALQRTHNTGSAHSSSSRDSSLLLEAEHNLHSTASVAVQQGPVPGPAVERTDRSPSKRSGKKPPQQQREHKDLSGAEKALRHLLAGATAAVVAKSAVAPLERLKLDYMLSNFAGAGSAAAGAAASELAGAGGAQVWAQAGRNGAAPAATAIPAVAPHAGRALHQLRDATHRILVEEGWQGLWRGNGVNLLRIVPFKTLNFFFFDVFRAQLTKQRLHRQRQRRRAKHRSTSTQQQPVGNLQSRAKDSNQCQGRQAGAWQGTGLLKERVGPGVIQLLGAARDTLQGRGSVQSLASAAGCLLGLQSDAGGSSSSNSHGLPTDTSIAQSSSTTNGAYSTNTGSSTYSDTDIDTDSDNLNTASTNVERAIAGAASGTVAAILCFPLDTVRTRLVARGGVMCAGDILGCCLELVRYEGISSLYRGLLPALLSMAPAGAVFYGTYDFLKAAHLKAAAPLVHQGHTQAASGTAESSPQQHGLLARERGEKGETGEGGERGESIRSERDSDRRGAERGASTSLAIGSSSHCAPGNGLPQGVESTGRQPYARDAQTGSGTTERPASVPQGASTSQKESQWQAQQGQQQQCEDAALLQPPSATAQQQQQKQQTQRRPQQAQAQQHQSSLQQLGVVPTLVYGAMAGAAAEVATFPLEVVRRQMQLGGKRGSGGLGDIARVMREVIRKGGGPQALYAGILPATLQVLPSAAISYLIFEVMKTWLRIDS